MYEDARRFNIDATIMVFGNNELSISGEKHDSDQHHLKFTGVKQYVTPAKYEEYRTYGDAFLSAYAVRDGNFKENIKTDDYKNAMVYLFYENFQSS